MTTDRKIPVSCYFESPILAFIDEQAVNQKRSRAAQIEYMIEEQKRVIEHNLKAQAERGARS